MAQRSERSVLYHIPKCAGHWARRAAVKAGVPLRWCHNEVGHPWDLRREHAAPSVLAAEDRDGLFGICFVRRPIDWYRSFWCFRAKGYAAGGRGNPRFPADQAWSDDPEAFCEELARFPGGFLTALFREYANHCAYVGRLENIRHDLVEALALAGEEFDPVAIHEYPRFARTVSDPEWTARWNVGEATRARVERAERWVLETYYVKE